MLATSPGLARERAVDGATRRAASAHYLHAIEHYVYVGDTALHIAAAAYQKDIVENLIALGADVRARNRRGAEPSTTPPTVDRVRVHGIRKRKRRQSPAQLGLAPTQMLWTTAASLLCTAPCVRVARRPCRPFSRLARIILAKNKSGATPLRLAIQNTGRGGSGSAEAKAQQQEVRRLLGDSRGR